MVVWPISRTFSSYKPETPYPLNDNSPVTPHPHPQPLATTIYLLFYELDYSRPLIHMDPYNICPFVIGLFHSA